MLRGLIMQRTSGQRNSETPPGQSQPSPFIGKMKIVLFYCIIFFLVWSCFGQLNEDTIDQDGLFECIHPVYCRGEILDLVQMRRVYPDGKSFVDRPMKYPLAVIVDNFKNLKSDPTDDDIVEFVETNFEEAGSDLVAVVPNDYSDDPPKALMDGVKDVVMHQFARDVHQIWKNLVKIHIRSGYESSFIDLPHPFVVPAGRFREPYYWDEYFILEGLLESGMFQTAKNTILNFFYMLDKFGHVPNGARIYYLNRSQPPLLTQMVASYFEATKDEIFLEYSLKYLDKEYDFWMSNRTVNVKGHVLNQYHAQNHFPRPESYYEDFTLAEKIPKAKRHLLYKDIASAAESGWDFSTRWFKDDNIDTIQTTNVLPIDLNSFLYRNEKNLSYFHDLVGNHEKADYYDRQAEKRAMAINEVLWDEKNKIWNDYDLKKDEIKVDFTAACVTPLWAGLDPQVSATTLLESVEKALEFKGGIPTTFSFNSTQQWDGYNSWAPLIWFWVKGFQHVGLQTEAKSIASRWLTNNYCGFIQTGEMFEKYSVNRFGPGSGGEYEVQSGFGWTNGVALKLIKMYGKEISIDPRVCDPPSGWRGGVIFLIFLILSVISIIFVFSSGIIALIMNCTKKADAPRELYGGEDV